MKGRREEWGCLKVLGYIQSHFAAFCVAYKVTQMDMGREIALFCVPLHCTLETGDLKTPQLQAFCPQPLFFFFFQIQTCYLTALLVKD